MRALSCLFADVIVTPTHQECPFCHLVVKRVWTAYRYALDVSIEKLGMLRVKVGVYRCEDCRKYFRNQPSFLYPDCIYTNRVVSMALASVFEDGMPATGVSKRFERDFGISPTEGTIRHWIKNRDARSALYGDYDQWVVESFSGVLCVDEVYQGKFAVLLAVDPAGEAGDTLVGHLVIEGDVDKSHVENFLGDLKNKGINPVQVITDGSALYPGVVNKIWPNVSHQLCLFHQTQSMVKSVGHAVKDLNKSIPKGKGKGGSLSGKRANVEYGPKVEEVFF